MQGERPRPVLDVWNAPFWAAAREHRFSVQRCESCGQLRFPPGPSCPGCLAEAGAWVDLSGTGIVQSWVVFHQVYFPGLAEAIPYNVVQLRLDEGLRFLSNLVGVVNGEIRVGMPVSVVFEDIDADFTLPRFRPA